MTRVGWIDCSSGVSGDMLLAALHSLGVLDDLPDLCRSLDIGVQLAIGSTTRHGLAGTTVEVGYSGEQPQRRLPDVLAVLATAGVPVDVIERASAVFRRLATAEAAVHGVGPDEVHFHEVGAVDAIVDVLGGCLGFARLGADLVASPIALGGGTARSAHGVLPVPVPAVLELLRGCALTGIGGPVDVELATPTGVALLAEWASRTGLMPPMGVEQVGVGAGGRDLAERPNLLRIAVGVAAGGDAAGDDDWYVVESNVDDLDPRLWPGVLAQLMTAGAADAWLTPIVMKKGRPAHTVAALAAVSTLNAVRGVLWRETSTIGLRESRVVKHALARTTVTVTVDGHPVRVKVATEVGELRNASPEFEDVAAAAAALGRPVKDVLGEAAAAARNR